LEEQRHNIPAPAAGSSAAARASAEQIEKSLDSAARPIKQRPIVRTPHVVAPAMGSSHGTGRDERIPPVQAQGSVSALVQQGLQRSVPVTGAASSPPISAPVGGSERPSYVLVRGIELDNFGEGEGGQMVESIARDLRGLAISKRFTQRGTGLGLDDGHRDPLNAPAAVIATALPGDGRRKSRKSQARRLDVEGDAWKLGWCWNVRQSGFGRLK